MNCEQVKDNLLLYLYNELEEREHEALQEHLESCPSCASVLAQERRLLGRLDQRRSAHPSNAMLAECRHDLMRSVYHQQEDNSRGASRLPTWSDLSRVFASSPRAWQPVAALVLLVVGFYFGRASVGAPAGEASVSDIRSASLIPWETSVGEIQSVERDPDDGTVEIVLEETTRRTISGAPHDPYIRGLLISAVRDYPNSGVRLETLDALRHRVDDREVRLALREAMVRDRNPGVRLTAFEALRVYHGEPDIREALKQVLRQDEIPGMRIQVIDSLTEKPDGELVGLLQELVESDENRYVRLKCRRALRQLNASEERF